MKVKHPTLDVTYDVAKKDLPRWKKAGWIVPTTSSRSSTGRSARKES